MFPTLVIGTINISLYWLMFWVGVVSMGYLLLRRRQRYDLSVFKAMLATALITVFGVVGAKMLGVVQNWSQVREEGLSAAGFSFFGAVYLVPVGLMLFAKPLGTSKTKILDAIAPCMASIVAFMRFGCYLNGCCGGTKAELLGYTFRWPTQAIESIGDFFVLAMILQLEEENRYNGKYYAVFLSGYGVLRFFVEFLRDTDKRIMGLGDGQLLAILAVAIGCFILTRRILADHQVE